MTFFYPFILRIQCKPDYLLRLATPGVAMFALFLVSVILTGPLYAEEYFPSSEPEGGWRRLIGNPGTPPTSQQKREVKEIGGMDWDKLQEAWNASKKFGGSFLVIRNGYIVGEWGSTGSRSTVPEVHPRS